MAFEIARALPPVRGRDRNIAVVLSRWCASDPVKAFTILEGLPGRDYFHLASSMASTWAKKDTPAALACATKLKDSRNREFATGAVIEEWAATSGAEAAAALESLSFKLPPSRWTEVARNWATDDRREAIRWARSLKRNPERSAALFGCVAQLGFGNEADLAIALKEMPAGPAREKLISNLADRKAWIDPAGLLPWFRSLAPEDAFAAFKDNSALYNLAAVLPYDALTLLDELPHGFPKPDLNHELALSLTNEDPLAALAWAEKIKSPKARASAQKDVIVEWATLDPVTAIAQAREHLAPEARQEILKTVIEVWTGSDAREVAVWAEKAEPDLRMHALLHAALTLSRGNGAAAAKLFDTVVRSTGTGEQTEHLRGSAALIARNWAHEDLVGVCQWVATLPPGPVAEDATGAIAEAWAVDDPEAVDAWITALPAGKARDLALAHLASCFRKSDPKRAFLLASDIVDHSLQFSSVQSRYIKFLQHDADDARKTLEEVDLPERLRAELLRLEKEAGSPRP